MNCFFTRQVLVIISKDSKQVGRQRNAQCSDRGQREQVGMVGPAMNATAN